MSDRIKEIRERAGLLTSGGVPEIRKATLQVIVDTLEDIPYLLDLLAAKDAELQRAKDFNWIRGKSQAVVFCPHCNFSEEGTTFDGELYNPCDPGCCCILACPSCSRVFTLKEKCKPPCDCHYHALMSDDEPASQPGGPK